MIPRRPLWFFVKKSLTMHIVSLNTETMKPRHILYLILLLLIPAAPLSAIPARNILHTFTQPDGTTFHARLQGDEHLHLVMDEQGHSLIRGNDGDRKSVG